MAFDDCIREIKAASGDKIDDADAARILQMAFDRAARYEKDGLSRADAAIKAGRELGDEARVAAAIKKRSLLINIDRIRALHALETGSKESETFRAKWSGIEGPDRELGNSVHAHGIAEGNTLLGGVIGELRPLGLEKVAMHADRDLQLDIVKEMWRAGEPEKWPETGNKISATIGGVFGRYIELARVGQNAAGAFIRKIENYVVRQSHDMHKISGGGWEMTGTGPRYRQGGTDADFVAWRDHIEPRLDERTFEGVEDRGSFLQDVWRALSTGVHDSAGGGDWLAGFQGSGNLAKRLSEERVLHFKDATAFFEYNERFGKGSIVDSVVNTLQHAGKNIALMRAFGPNPEAMSKHWLETMTRKAQDRGDFREVVRLQKGWNERLMDTVTGKANIPDNLSLAAIGQTARNAQAFTKLGFSAISSFSDIGSNVAMLRWNGVPFLERWGETVLAPFRGRRVGGETRETRALMDDMGVGFGTLANQLTARFFASDGIPGAGAKAVQLSQRWNFQGFWTDSMSVTTGSLVARQMTRSLGRDFAKLNERQQITLRRFGIEDAEWRAFKHAELRAADGNNYLTPAAMLSLPDAAVAHIAPEGATARQLDSVREGLRSKLGTFISEQVREGMNEPRASDRLALMWGSEAKPGTPVGEFVRTVMQFKQFAITFARRSLGRELYRAGHVDVGGLVGLMVSTTLLGAASMTITDYLKGRNPRQPKDAQGAAKYAFAAMQKGGGLGIYGDFLLGNSSKALGGFAGALGGPTLGTAEQLFDVWQTIKDGGTTKTRGELLAAEGVGLLKSMTPNLFYSDLAVKHLFLYGLQEAVNPGYLRRHEKRVERERNQTFWLSPTQAVRY